MIEVKTEVTSVVVDTHAWIEFFRGSDKGNIVFNYLLTTRNTYTPSIVLGGVARKYARENIPIKSIEKRLEVITSVSRIIYIDEKSSP